MNRKERRRLNKQAGTAEHPRAAVDPLQAAMAHHQAGRLTEAEKIYQQILQVDPNHSAALNLLGVAAIQVGKNEIAVDLISKSVAIKSDDADAHFNLGNAYRGLGELDEAAASYYDALAIKPDYAEANNNLGGILQDLGRFDEAIANHQKALATRPDDANTHYNLGKAFKELGRLEEAVENYRKVLAIMPNYSAAANNLGTALQDLGQYDEAIENFRKALATNPDYVSAHYNLGNAYFELGRFDEAVSSYQMALAIKPDDAEVHYNLGNAFKELAKLKEAMASCRKALDIKPDYTKAQKNLSLYQLSLGDFHNGWKNYECRFLGDDLAPKFQEYDSYDRPLWQGADVDGKRLLLWEEQGVGESILFTSMIPDSIERGAEIILECDKRLIPLFSRSFSAVTCTGMSNPGVRKAADMKFDLHAPFGNPGRWFRPNLASFPDRASYLVADESQRQTLRNRYLERENDFLVGISWYSKNVSIGEQKSMTLQDLRPLLEMPDTTFINLQYGDTSEERKAFASETGLDIYHDDGVDQMADLDIFASQVAAMDMVVTISNTTAHMAGALGIPTLLMLGTVPLWYWLMEREDNPWYPSFSLIRQQERGDWQGVVERARKELAARVGDR